MHVPQLAPLESHLYTQGTMGATPAVCYQNISAFQLYHKPFLVKASPTAQGQIGTVDI